MKTMGCLGLGPNPLHSLYSSIDRSHVVDFRLAAPCLSGPVVRLFCLGEPYLLPDKLLSHCTTMYAKKRCCRHYLHNPLSTANSRRSTFAWLVDMKTRYSTGKLCAVRS
jgi:hypothetical protein